MVSKAARPAVATIRRRLPLPAIYPSGARGCVTAAGGPPTTNAPAGSDTLASSASYQVVSANNVLAHNSKTARLRSRI
jgi:hypothetical protein